jgi:hypothetical protein
MRSAAFALAILATITSTSAMAAQFEGAVEAIAIKSTATHTNNGWEDTQKIKGVKWKWPYHQSGAHDSTMVGMTKVGKDKNPNIGATEVSVTGARTFVSKIKIRIQNEGESPSESAVKNLLGGGKVKKINTSCDDNSTSNGDATFRFEKSGYKPVFVRYSSSFGASGAGGVDIIIANVFDDLGDCKLSK